MLIDASAATELFDHPISRTFRVIIVGVQFLGRKDGPNRAKASRLRSALCRSAVAVAARTFKCLGMRGHFQPPHGDALGAEALDDNDACEDTGLPRGRPDQPFGQGTACERICRDGYESRSGDCARQVAGGTPSSRLNARLNAASDS
jgi:hypothetical protein